MREVALVSELSRHKLKDQQAEYRGMPQYLAPDEIPVMVRPTLRNTGLAVHMISLAVAADKRQKFIEFFKSLPKNSKIVSKEDGNINCKMPIDDVLKLWTKARQRGATQAGGAARSELACVDFWKKFSKIVDRWHGDERSKDLLRESGIAHHDTVRANIGYTRWEWRRLSDAKRERIIKQKEKEFNKTLERSMP